MIAIRQQGSKSWLDYRYGRVKAAQLASRLVERCGGCEGLFLTLTYDRTGETYDVEGYDDPLELYRAAKEEKHVAMFFRRLERITGKDFSGQWICKMEFQHGGWLHWHIVLVGVSFVSWDDIMLAWGHGNCRFDVLDEEKIGYFCKYVSKDGSLPAFLLAERQRSVRVVRCSPGFWGNVTVDDVPLYGPPEFDPDYRPPNRTSYPWGITVGESLERLENAALIKDLDNDTYLPLPDIDYGDISQEIYKAGGKFVSTENGFNLIDCISIERVKLIVESIRGRFSRFPVSESDTVHRRPPSGSGAGRGPAPAIYLNNSSHRDFQYEFGVYRKWEWTYFLEYECVDFFG